MLNQRGDNVMSAKKRLGEGWIRNQGSLEASASCNLFITSFTFRGLGLPLVTRSKLNEFQSATGNIKQRKNVDFMLNHKVLECWMHQ